MSLISFRTKKRIISLRERPSFKKILISFFHSEKNSFEKKKSRPLLVQFFSKLKILNRNKNWRNIKKWNLDECFVCCQTFIFRFNFLALEV